MELRVIDKAETELSIEIAGEDHTFMTYDVNPEQSGGQTEPILTVKTEDGVDPLDALEEGAERVSEKSTELRAAYEAAG